MHDDTTASEEQLPPEDEVRRIAAAFDEYRSLSERWETAGSSTSRWGSARVCRVRPGRVLHVVGASEMAESLRDLLSRGEVVGWALQPMAETRTPLDHFLPQFRGDGDAERPGDARGYNQLDRAGFVYGEEVAACPDDVLLRLRNLGPKALSTIRRIIGGPPSATPETASRIQVTSASPVPSAERTPERTGQVADTTEALALTPAARARYPGLAAGLVNSGMPGAAVDKIVASLNAEARPPADPLVTLLLDTAGATTLLELYRATHGPDL